MRALLPGAWVVAAVAGLALGASAARALPAPMSAEDLEKNSDVVATVRVLAVVCTGQVPYGKTTEQTTTYQAWLQVVSVKKGDVKENQTLLVAWQDVPKKLIGPWKVEYLPGEEVPTYLKWNAEQKAYHTTWWNAKGKPTKPATADKLPEKDGQVIIAKDLGEAPK